MDYQKERHNAGQLHLNMNGTLDFIGVASLSLLDSPDEKAERQKIYAEAKSRFSVDPKSSSCEYMESTIANIQNVIDAALQSKANDVSKSNTRVQNRYIDAYTWWQNDVKTMYNNKQCVKIQEQQEQEQFFNTQYENLEKVQELSQKAGSTTKYVVLGMLGLTVVVAGIILFKKK